MPSAFRAQAQLERVRRAIELSSLESDYDCCFHFQEANGASENRLEKVLLILETWDGEDVGEMAKHFFLIDTIDEVKRWFYSPALQDTADRVGELRNSLVSNRGNICPSFNLRDWSPILEGRNGSILWFSPAFGIYAVTEQGVGLPHASDGGHSYYDYVGKVVLSHDDFSA